MADLDWEIQREFDKSPAELKDEAEQFNQQASSDPEVVASYLPRLQRLLEAAGSDRDDILIRDDVQRAILTIAERKPEALSDQYPELVAAFLDTRETRVLTRGLLHECARLRSNGVTVQTITEGLDTAEGEVVDQLVEIADSFDEEGAVPGNGATVLALSQRLRDFADTVAGREQLVVEAVADGLFDLVRYQTEEHGLDPIDGGVDLRAQYDASGEPFTYGFTDSQTVGDVRAAGTTRAKNEVLRYVIDALVGTALIVTVERSEPRLLRMEAVLAERSQ